MKNEVSFDIKKEIATISENGYYSKRLTLISWNNGPEKYDLRNWYEKEDKLIAKGGITLSQEELYALADAIEEERRR